MVKEALSDVSTPEPKTQGTAKRARARPTPSFDELQRTAVRQSGNGDGFQLFRLPPEIRNMIYQQFVPSDDTIFVAIRYCVGKKDNWYMHSGGSTNGGCEIFLLNSQLAKLLRTSKQAYLECLPFLYAKLVVLFTTWPSLNTTLSRLGQNGRSLVVSLENDPYLRYSSTATYSVLSRVPHIKNLTRLRKVSIYLYAYYVTRNASGDDMHPVCSLRGIELEVVTYECRHLAGTQAFVDKMVAHVAQPKEVST